MINFDSSNIPPCTKSLSQKILQTILVNAMWQNATEPKCILYEPTECGWQHNEDNKLEPLWYDGQAAPLKVNEIISNNENEDETKSQDDQHYDCDDINFNDY